MKKNISVTVVASVVMVLLMTAMSPAFGRGTNEKIILEPLDDPCWQWAAGGGGYSVDYGYCVAVDTNGNSYITGKFHGSALFGTTSLTSFGGWDVFVAKLDANGVWQWAVNAGSVLQDEGASIAIDDQGNSYITGVFYDVAWFGNITLASLDGLDVFVAKLDTNGIWQWAVRGGGYVGEAGYGIAVDDNGNSYVTGHFMWSATFGSTQLSSQGSADVFVAKLDTNGDWIWAVSGGGSLPDYVCDIALDSGGNIVLTGDFEGSATFGNETITSLGTVDVFIVKLDNDGDWLWARSGGSASIERGYDVAVDSSDNAYITGVFLVSITFGTTTLSSQGSWDVYVVKLDGDGNWQWAVRGGSSSTEGAWGIAVDTGGNPSISGVFDGPVTFGASSLICQGCRDVFVATLDTDGVWQWAISGGGADWDEGYALAIDDSGYVYVTGYFDGSAMFGETMLTTQGDFDVFVAKMSHETVNQPPVADFSFSPEKPLVGQSVTFNASHSYDPDGDIVSFIWDFGDEVAGNGMTIDHVYSWADSFAVSLTVTDREGLTDTIIKQIEVCDEQAEIDFSITGRVGVNVVITNTGTEDVSSIPWCLQVQGGFLRLIHKTAEGTIDVPGNGSATVGTGIILGFGPLVITARVGSIEKRATGTQIIIFSMVDDG